MDKKEKVVNVLCYDLIGFRAQMNARTDGENNPPKHSAIISICPKCYNYGEYHYFDSSHYNVLNMDFDDGGPTEYWGKDEDKYDHLLDYWLEFGEFSKLKDAFDFQSKERPEENIHFMDYNDAYKCVEFIDWMMNEDDIDTIYLHCTAGASRSQGVVRYILDMYDKNGFKIILNENNPCLTPNAHVVMMLKRAARVFFDRKDIRSKYNWTVTEIADAPVPKKNVYEITVRNEFNNDTEEETYDVESLFNDELWFLLLCYFSNNTDKKQLDFCAEDKKARKYVCGKNLYEDLNFPWLYDYFSYQVSIRQMCPHPLRLYSAYYDSECDKITEITIYHWLFDGSRNRVELPKMFQLFKTREEMVAYMTDLYNKKKEEQNA